MINRSILPEILNWLGKKKILILKGARQVGKTTLMGQLKEKILEKNANNKVVSLCADDLANKSIFESPANLELYLKNSYNFPNEYLYLMIDEFQFIDQAGLFLKNIFDKYKDKMQLIVSGSSSLEITKNSEFLTGRKLDFQITPITFLEYFNYKNNTSIKPYSLDKLDDISLFYKTYRLKLDMYFNEYLFFGGYPEVLTTNEIERKKRILSSIIQTYVEKDIAHFLRIENINGFNNLIEILSAQIGSLVNIAEISNTVNMAINTVKKYLDVLIGTYVCNIVTPYYKNIRSEISKMPKIYFSDVGTRNYFTRFAINPNLISGELIENFVYLYLSQIYSNRDIHFYRTVSGSEIDFLVHTGAEELLLCEVKYRSKIKLISAFKRFEKKYLSNLKISRKVVITKDKLEIDNNIFYIPACVLPFVDLSTNSR